MGVSGQLEACGHGTIIPISNQTLGGKGALNQGAIDFPRGGARSSQRLQDGHMNEYIYEQTPVQRLN